MKKRTVSLSIVTGLVLVFLFTSIASGCGKKTPSTTAPDGTTATTAPEKTTSEPSSQPLSSSSASETKTEEASTEEITETAPDTEPETGSSSLPTDGPEGWTGSVMEETVDPSEGAYLVMIQDEFGDDVEVIGIRNSRWMSQPFDTTSWTVIPEDMEVTTTDNARVCVMRGSAFDGKVTYTLIFQMFAWDEKPEHSPYFPESSLDAYKTQGYTVDHFYYNYDWPQEKNYFGVIYDDIMGFWTKFTGVIQYCENSEKGNVILDQGYIAYYQSGPYNILVNAKVETTKEMYDALVSGELEIDDEHPTLYAIFKGAAKKYPDVTYPLARYLTVDFFGNGTDLFRDWYERN